MLSPMVLVVQPEPFFHGLRYGFGLMAIGCWVFANDFSNACRSLVVKIVIGSSVGDGSTAII